MTDIDSIQACQDVVVGYCHAINEWERIRSILGRIESGQYTSALDRESVAGLTLQSHSKAHEKIFERFVVPRERKHASNPGAPNSWSKDGSYHDVDPETIRTVQFPGGDLAEIVTDWGFQLPGGKTMFVLARRNGTWLIDNLKIAVDDSWEVVCL